MYSPYKLLLNPTLSLEIMAVPVRVNEQLRNLNGTSFLQDKVTSSDYRFRKSQALHVQVIPKPHPIDLAGSISEMEVPKMASELNIIDEYIKYIKWLLGSMDDGRISASPYVTAWVALIEDTKENGDRGPMFPSCLQWIAKNQLADGSWGLENFFSAYDRLINTLACVIALKTWNMNPQKTEKGISFLKENISKLEDENTEHMTVGFEVLFPCLIEMARKLKIEIPNGTPVLQNIYALREQKLAKIPRDVLHTQHTTLLFSLEGQQGLDWEKILKLQCEDGSLLYSPSSTAFAYMETRDENCLRYLSQLVEKFNGGVPYVYPVDLFARNWAVDRLQRLGISRYFQAEINQCVDYTCRYWTERGIYSIRNSPFQNIDDTAMGFRALRLHGYDVSGHDEQFCCFPRQSSESVTALFNTYRASQLLFPGEKALEEVKEFTYKFLLDRYNNNQLSDKWAILKDLPGEVTYALEMPWYASLPRVETRLYIQQYGGEDDIWIGKSLHKMPEVNNNVYLELAKLDYNKCQDAHRMEWISMQDWCAEHNLREFCIKERSLLYAYFIATANIFEPERSGERLAWAKSATLVEVVISHFNKQETSPQKRRAFIQDFKAKSRGLDVTGRKSGELVGVLLKILRGLSDDAYKKHNINIWFDLCDAWEGWLTTWLSEDDSCKCEAKLIVQTICFCSGRLIGEEPLSNQTYMQLSNLTNRVCHQLQEFRNNNKATKGHGITRVIPDSDNITTAEIEANMQKLVQLVLIKSPSDGISQDTKDIFFSVARSFYYIACCHPSLVNIHISKVLFQQII